MEIPKPTEKQLKESWQILQFLLVAVAPYPTDCFLLIRATKTKSGRTQFHLVSSALDKEESERIKNLSDVDYFG